MKELDRIMNARIDKICDEFKDNVLKDFNRAMNGLIYTMVAIAIICFIIEFIIWL